MYQVLYKYNAEMPIIRKPIDEFINSVLEKALNFTNGEHKPHEIHVCMFIKNTLSNKYVYYPVFDFDDGVHKQEIVRFIKNELIITNKCNPKNIIVEASVTGYHVVCLECFGEYTKEQIDDMRHAAAKLYNKLYRHMDITTSFRLMPIRRTPSLTYKEGVRIYPIKFKQFLSMSEHDIRNVQKHKKNMSISEVNYIIRNLLIPKSVVLNTERKFMFSKI